MQSAPLKEEITGGHKIEISDNIKWQTDRVAPKRKDMFGKTKSLFLIVASMLCMASCDSIREDLPRCELWVEFVFDYNMEYADAFHPQVKSVDVLVFDSDDKLLFTKSAEVAALVGGSRMTLTDELDFGSYKVLTVGSLSDRFRLSDNAGNKLVPGTTTLQQVIVSLKREMGVVNFEFQHLYFGEVVEVDHPAIQYQP